MNKSDFEKYLQTQDKKHVIFDFDKTITELLVDWSYWRNDLTALFLSYDNDFDINNFANWTEAQNFYIESFGDEIRDKIIEISYRVEKEHYSGNELVPVALEILDSAKKHAELYIWSSNDKRTIEPIIKELNVETLFDKIVSRNDVTYIKPNPSGFDLIFNPDNSKSAYLMIGDSEFDRFAAQNSEIDFINISEFEI